METTQVRELLTNEICGPVEEILGYKFNNRQVLLEAMTHRSFKDTYNLSGCYEKLEVLGDAILDYIANSNLLRYTLFDRYNIQERRQRQYITPEDFKPFDAHQAKSHLTKNDFLAKLVCLTGIHEFILFDKPDQAPIMQAFTNEIDWKQKREETQQMMEKEIDKYVLYSFKKNFALNQRDIELFEPSKILGDVFEALIGAVYIDSAGMDGVLQVYQHLLCPFVLYVAKFNKKLKIEPKEDFMILAQLNKIIPNFRMCE
jgi:dsRNA-specific ribonuclease